MRNLQSPFGIRSPFGGRRWTPARLFSGGAQGLFLDPSDLTTMFQDRAGTTPVTAPGQSVGLVLDKSKGLGLGPELVTNGDFTNGTTGWSSSTAFASTAAVVSGEFQVTASVSSGRQVSAISCVVGKTYLVVGSCRLISGTGFAFIGISDALAGAGIYTAANNNTSTPIQTRAQFVATNTTMYVVAGSTEGTGVTGFDNISVKELPGNHATQATAASRPTYQVDGNGRGYLSFDGVDDFLVTPTITPGTDKAQVFAGVRKLSDANRASIVESGANQPSSIRLEGPPFAGGQAYGFGSSGTVPTFNYASSSGFAAPITSVLTGLSDIAGDLATLRVNGTQVAQSTADQGTGNFNAYPLYIGRRAGTSLPFNCRIYGLITRFGPNLTANQISQTERWMAQRTGMTI